MYDTDRLLGLPMLFLFEIRPGEVHPPRTVRPGRETIELIVSGRGAYAEAGTWHPAGPGDLLWHRAGDTTLGRPDPQDPYRCLALRVLVDPATPCPAPRRARWDDLGQVAAFAQDAVRRWTDRRCDRQLLLHQLYATLLSVAERHALGGQDGLPAALTRVLARIDAEFARDLAVADLARTAGWSAQHLHDACRIHLGTSPHALIRERRLRAVRELLVASDLPLAVVAERCGFSSPATLCRAFRQAHGASPAAWRTRHR